MGRYVDAARAGCGWVTIGGLAMLTGACFGEVHHNLGNAKDARAACVNAIRDGLRAPAYATISDVRLTYSESQVWTFSMHVDGRNSTGYRLRPVWTCTATEDYNTGEYSADPSS
jgi:hypothetical protein